MLSGLSVFVGAVCCGTFGAGVVRQHIQHQIGVHGVACFHNMITG